MSRKCVFNLLSFWLIFVFYSENLKTAFAVLHIAASNHAMLMLISVSRPGPGQHFPWQPFFPKKTPGKKSFPLTGPGQHFPSRSFFLKQRRVKKSFSETVPENYDLSCLSTPACRVGVSGQGGKMSSSCPY